MIYHSGNPRFKRSAGIPRLHNNRIIKFRGYFSVDMQLPRGSFHANKKGIRLVQLLKDLSGEGFTGYCILIRRQLSATLVLKGGVPILASSGTLMGEEAVGVIRNLGEGDIDASISILTDSQLRLALEFNPSARLGKEQLKTRVARHEGLDQDNRPVIVPSSGTVRGVLEEDAAVNRVDRTRPAVESGIIRAREGGESTGSGSVTPVRAAMGTVTEEISHGNILNPGQPVDLVPEETPGSLVEHELEALEAMDLEAMCNRIRENCRTTVKGLKLDHLFGEQGESSGDGLP